jgi:hypothetical protein
VHARARPCAVWGTGVIAQCPGVYGATFDTCVIPQHAEQIPFGNAPMRNGRARTEHSRNLWNTAPQTQTCAAPGPRRTDRYTLDRGYHESCVFSRPRTHL